MGQRSAGTFTKVADTKFWKELKDAWRALPQERSDVYKRLAAGEITIAKEARTLWRSNGAAASLSLTCAAAAPQGTLAFPDRATPHGSVVHASRRDVGALLVGLSDPQPTGVAIPRSGPPSSHPDPQPLPLSTDVLDTYMSTSTLASLKRELYTKANKFQQTREFVIPDKVDYGSQCRGLCGCSPAVQLGMQDLLWQHLARVFNAPTKVNSDFLIVYEVYRLDMDPEPTHVGFALLTACSCRYGRHPAHQDFLRLDVLSQPNGLTSAGYKACILGARRAKHCCPHADIPRHFNKFLEGAQGEFDIVTEDVDKRKRLLHCH